MTINVLVLGSKIPRLPGDHFQYVGAAWQTESAEVFGGIEGLRHRGFDSCWSNISRACSRLSNPPASSRWWFSYNIIISCFHACGLIRCSPKEGPSPPQCAARARVGPVDLVLALRQACSAFRPYLRRNRRACTTQARGVNRLPGVRRQFRPNWALMAIPPREQGRSDLRGVRSMQRPGADRQPA